MAAHVAGLVAEPAGVEKQTRALHRPAGHHDGACLQAFRGVVSTPVFHPDHPVTRAPQHPGDNRPGAHFTVARGPRLGDEGNVHAALVEARAATGTVATVVTGWATVVGCRQGGEGIGYP